MAKSEETLRKVAETFTKKGDAAWASAKSGEHPAGYAAAKSFYGTAEKATKSADALKKK